MILKINLLRNDGFHPLWLRCCYLFLESGCVCLVLLIFKLFFSLVFLGLCLPIFDC